MEKEKIPALPQYMTKLLNLEDENKKLQQQVDTAKLLQSTLIDDVKIEEIMPILAAVILALPMLAR